MKIKLKKDTNMPKDVLFSIKNYTLATGPFQIRNVASGHGVMNNLKKKLYFSIDQVRIMFSVTHFLLSRSNAGSFMKIYNETICTIA